MVTVAEKVVQKSLSPSMLFSFSCGFSSQDGIHNPFSVFLVYSRVSLWVDVPGYLPGGREAPIVHPRCWNCLSCPKLLLINILYKL